MKPSGHSNRMKQRHTQRILHRTGAERIFPGFGLKKCGLPALRIQILWDISVWAILEAKACGKFHFILDQLKHSLQRAGKEIPQENFRAATEGTAVD